LFLARGVNGVLAVEPAGNTDTGGVFTTLGVPGVGVLIQAEKGWFRDVTTPLSMASVDMPDKKNLVGSPNDP
jgi:hypothetical protein